MTMTKRLKAMTNQNLNFQKSLKISNQKKRKRQKMKKLIDCGIVFLEIKIVNWKNEIDYF
jgi:hypothetical protein